MTGLLLLGLSGCEGESPIIAPPQSNVLDSSPQTVLGAEHTRSFTVLCEAVDVPTARYEPNQGCYIGAQLTTGEYTDEGIDSFENSIQKHAVYACDMRLNDDFPEEWLLSCIATQSTPFIILRPDQSGSLFDLTGLAQTATTLGAYNVPMFVAFFPVTDKDAYEPVEYTLYFRYARAVFADFAPMAAFVWVADAGLNEPERWYPGDDAVDWVGLSLINTLMDDGYTYDSLSIIDSFYKAYQKEKPIMLAPLAVSHFSSRDCTYHIREAATEIERIYTAIQNEYPRIKLVVYYNINGMDNSIRSGEEDDYTVTQDDTMRQTYRDNVSERYFRTAVQSEEDQGTTWLRSEYPAYYKDGVVYIAENTFIYDLKHPTQAEPAWISGARYVSADALEQDTALFAVIDYDEELIHIYRRTN